MFGAEIYSEAFKRGLKGEVVTSGSAASLAEKDLPYEACGSFLLASSHAAWAIGSSQGDCSIVMIALASFSAFAVRA